MIDGPVALYLLIDMSILLTSLTVQPYFQRLLLVILLLLKLCKVFVPFKAVCSYCPAIKAILMNCDLFFG